MKNLFTIAILLLIVTFAKAQETTLNVLVNNHYAQVEVERSEEKFYYKAYVGYAFTENFSNVGLGFGYNTSLDRFDRSSFYIGLKSGLISHKNQGIAGNASPGIETGIDLKLSDRFYIGGRYSLDWREDLKFYGVNYNPSLKGSFLLKLRFKIN